MDRRWRLGSRVWLITVWAPRLGDVRDRMLLHSRLKGSAVSRPCSALKVREERAHHQHILPGAAIPRGKGWGAILRGEGPHPRHRHVDAWVGSGNTWPRSRVSWHKKSSLQVSSLVQQTPTALNTEDSCCPEALGPQYFQGISL